LTFTSNGVVLFLLYFISFVLSVTFYCISDIEVVAEGDMVVCEVVEMIQEGLEGGVASDVVDQEVYPRVPQDTVSICVVYHFLHQMLMLSSGLCH
jgi:hypothetical protein